MSAPRIRTHDEAMRFLLEFVDYEKVTKYKYDLHTFDLGRVEELMAAIGNPHRAFRSIHVAGTKGKGSTTTMAQSILTAAGCRTGLYTSPHLCRIEERMTVDGEMMAEEEFVEIVNELAPYTCRQREERPNESPTFFELVTAAGFLHFARRGVEVAAVEVGMGGRLDATNVVRPEVCAITRVDFDHEERLGHTLDRIAFEKAGIIKPGVPVVCAPQAPEALSGDRGDGAAAGRRLDAGRRRLPAGERADGARRAAGAVLPLRPARARPGITGGSSCACSASTRRSTPPRAVAAVRIAAERCRAESRRRGGAARPGGGAQSGAAGGVRRRAADCCWTARTIRSRSRALCAALDGAFAGARLVLLMGVSRDKNVRGDVQAHPAAGGGGDLHAVGQPARGGAAGAGGTGARPLRRPRGNLRGRARGARARPGAGPAGRRALRHRLVLPRGHAAPDAALRRRGSRGTRAGARAVPAMKTILLLTVSNTFMTIAWYGHLKYRNKPLFLVIVVSWLIAFVEYCFQVPANRIGSYQFTTAQLKTIQEVITLVRLLRVLGPLSQRGPEVELPGGFRVRGGRGVLRVQEVVAARDRGRRFQESSACTPRALHPRRLH